MRLPVLALVVSALILFINGYVPEALERLLR